MTEFCDSIVTTHQSVRACCQQSCAWDAHESVYHFRHIDPHHMTYFPTTGASASPTEEAAAPAPTDGSAAPETPLHADDAAGGRPWNPSIRFPPRRTDKGDRISALAAQEADRVLRGR